MVGAEPFDELAVGVADGTISRGKALKTVFGGLMGGLLSLFALPAHDAEARTRLPKTLWVVVRSDGTVVSKSRGVQSVRKLGPPPSGYRANGDYEVVFSPNVSLCAKNATISSNDDSVPASGEIVVTQEFGTIPNFGAWVRVLTQNSSGAALDQPFSLVVHC